MVCIRLVLFLLIASTCFAQNFSTRTEMIYKARASNRMVNDTISLPDSVMILFVNDAAAATFDRLRCVMAFDTVWTTGGVATYAINSDCYPNAVLSVRILEDSINSTYQVAKRVGQDDQQQYTLSPTGVPLWYSTHGQYLSFLPPPTQGFRVEIEYEARPRVYASATDSLTTLQPEYEQLVVDYATYLVLKRFNMDFTPVLSQWKESVAEERALILKKPITNITEQGKP